MNLEGFNCFNIGSGSGVILKDLLEKIFSKLGYRTEIIDMGERLLDPKYLVADISKIKSIVGWNPEVDIDKGLDRTISYYLENYK